MKIFSLQYPYIKEKVKSFSICFLYCLTTDPMYVTAQTPAAGYIPGQTIELSLKFNNESNQTFRNFQIQLVKVSLAILSMNILYDQRTYQAFV